MQKILVIQTAFIGDVVLATAMLEKLHQQLPQARLDMLVRKGNETLFNNHPYLHTVLVWDKNRHKYGNLFTLIGKVRKLKYDSVINVQRYAATGLLTLLSGAGTTIGFDSNPFSRLFSQRIKHTKIPGEHEIERNQRLLSHFTGKQAVKPKLYPSPQDFASILQWQEKPYICMAPASVWFTKQFPVEKWIQFLDAIPEERRVYLLGGPGDQAICQTILQGTQHKKTNILAGKLGFLQSAALMQGALMNYVNDSAPLHFASAVNAPVTAIFCSTLPAFGYGPLSDRSHIVEIAEKLACRPCGVHGLTHCPLGHFHCATRITPQQLLSVLPIPAK